jgi:hypothetical protein
LFDQGRGDTAQDKAFRCLKADVTAANDDGMSWLLAFNPIADRKGIRDSG